MSGHEHTDHHFSLMATEDHSIELGHVVPFRTYVTVFLSLLFFTFVTVLVSRFDFGAFNMVVSMVVASIKATLVALFFMHLKYENKFTIAYALFPLILLAILLGGVFVDNPFRPGVNGPSANDDFSGGRVPPGEGEVGHGTDHH